LFLFAADFSGIIYSSALPVVLEVIGMTINRRNQPFSLHRDISKHVLFLPPVRSGKAEIESVRSLS